jgi:hypothetical protein
MLASQAFELSSRLASRRAGSRGNPCPPFPRTQARPVPGRLPQQTAGAGAGPVSGPTVGYAFFTFQISFKLHPPISSSHSLVV